MGFCVYNRKKWMFVEMNTNNCKYSIVSDYTKAHHFKKRKAASNFLENDTQKILNQSGWEVVSDTILKELMEQKTISEEDTMDDVPDKIKPFIRASLKIDEGLDDMEKLKNFKYYEADATLSESFEVPNIDIIGSIRQFENFLRKMKEYADVLSKQYTYIENCKLDYEHKIEFDLRKLSYMKRLELITNYVTCLEERRRIKDDILILEKLLNSSIKDLINGELDKFFQNMEKRSYRPRVAPELFQDADVVQVKPKFHLDSMSRDDMTKQAEALNESIEKDITEQALTSGGSLLSLISGFNPIVDCGE